MFEVRVNIDPPDEAFLPETRANAEILNDSGDPIEAGAPIAHVQWARPSAVKRLLEAEIGTGEGRSGFFWVRLHNGDLMLGVFPQGATYESLEGEPGTGWGDPSPFAKPDDPQGLLGYHVSGAIERGEAEAIVAVDEPMNRYEYTFGVFVDAPDEQAAWERVRAVSIVVEAAEARRRR